MIVLAVFFVTLFAYYIVLGINYKLERRRMVEMVNKFPGPKTVPIIGNALYFACSTEESTKRAIQLATSYKNPFRLWLFNKPIVFVNKPEDIQIIANKLLSKDSSYDLFVDAFGDGLLTAEVKKWRKHRRILNPVFNRIGQLKNFVSIFHKHNMWLISTLEKEVNSGSHFDLWPYLTTTSVKTISETAMGYNARENSDEITKFGNAVIKIALIVSQRMYKPWLQPSLIHNLRKRFIGYNEAAELIRNYPLKMFRKRKEELLNMEQNGDQTSNEGNQVTNFIDTLIKHHNTDEDFTEESIKEEVVSIMFGGSETSAVTNSFTLLMLAMNPKIQDRTYQEIFEVFGTSNRAPDFEDLMKLKYLEQCIKETMRRFCTVPLSFRYADEDVKLTDGSVIPKGASVCILMLGLHLNSDIYNNPMEWNPKNFDAELEERRHKCSFIPFSFGLRGCIGSKYAMLVMKSLLSTVLRNYKLSTDVKIDDIKPIIDLIIRNQRGYHVKIEHRNDKSIF